jgi:hypothetical protein
MIENPENYNLNAESPQDLIAVAEYRSRVQAETARLLLERENIPVFFFGEHLQGRASGLRGIEIRVPSDQARRALEIIQAYTQKKCRNCSSHGEGWQAKSWYRCPRLRIVLLKYFAAAFVLALPIICLRTYYAVLDYQKESLIRQVKVGMSEMEVQELLGSPDYIETDLGRKLIYHIWLNIDPGDNYFNLRCRKHEIVITDDGTVSETMESEECGHADCFGEITLRDRFWCMIRY